MESTRPEWLDKKTREHKLCESCDHLSIEEYERLMPPITPLRRKIQKYRICRYHDIICLPTCVICENATNIDSLENIDIPEPFSDGWEDF